LCPCGFTDHQHHQSGFSFTGWFYLLGICTQLLIFERLLQIVLIDVFGRRADKIGGHYVAFDFIIIAAKSQIVLHIEKGYHHYDEEVRYDVQRLIYQLLT